MLIDFLWTVLSVVIAGLFLFHGEPWQALMWAGVTQYAFFNWTDRKLKGSKYDY